MDEAGWLSSSDPAAMLELLTGQRSKQWPDSLWKESHNHTSDRKLRLFADICRERFFGSDSNGGTESKMEYEARVRDSTMTPQRAAECWAAEMAVSEQPVRANLLRCLFGNPFRPPNELRMVSQSPNVEVVWNYSSLNKILSWNDRTIPRLAQALYDSRDFDRMPILADALEEAGCENAEILSHCRGLSMCPECLGKGGEPSGYTLDGKQIFITCQHCSGLVPSRRKAGIPGWLKTDAPHARGCWALDLLLGKS